MCQESASAARILARLPKNKRKVAFVTCAPLDLRPLLEIGAEITVYYYFYEEGEEYFHADSSVRIEKVGKKERFLLNEIGFKGLTADLLWIHMHNCEEILYFYQILLTEESYLAIGALSSQICFSGVKVLEKNFRKNKYPFNFIKVDPEPELAVFCKMRIPRDIHFAVITMTYRRADGSSFGKLSEMIKSLNRQLYKNFTFFLMGDDYEDEEEFKAVGELFEKRPGGPYLYIENIKPALERSLCKKKFNLWGLGGYNTLNQGLRKARELNFKYYAHIDDDDVWHPNHLLTVANTYYIYPETTAVWTQGVCRNGWIMPACYNFYPNNFLPVGEDCFHSCFSFHLEKIPLEYKTIDPTIIERGEEEPELSPGDATVAIGIGNLVRKGLAVVTSPSVVTCYREDEGVRLI